MENTTLPRGHIENMGVLNLLAAKTEEDLRGIESIKNVGAVLVPANLSLVAAKIPMVNVGTLVPVADGEELVIVSGQTTMTGDALAAGDPKSLLLIVGQIFVTTIVTAVGYNGIQVVGQMFAPRGSEAALTAALRDLTGQILYTPENPRFVFGTESFGREFLQALPGPTPLLVFGTVSFDEDVEVEILRRAVPEIMLFGTILAPRRLLPILQVLTPQKFGTIAEKGVGDGDATDRPF